MSILPRESLPVSEIRKIRVLIETAEGRHTSRTVAVVRDAGEAEAVTRTKAVNAYRQQYGYADRIVSIDLYSA